VKNLTDLFHQERVVVDQLRSMIHGEFPSWSFRMTLFGSRARGEAESDSDMDILIEIDSERVSFEEKKGLRRLAGNLSLDSGILISLLIVDREILRDRGDFSIFRNIREEGLVV